MIVLQVGGFAGTFIGVGVIMMILSVIMYFVLPIDSKYIKTLSDESFLQNPKFFRVLTVFRLSDYWIIKLSDYQRWLNPVNGS